MWVEIGNLYTRVLRATEEERAWLREYLVFTNTSWANGRARAEKSSLYSIVDERFPSGFVALVKKAALDAGFTFEIGDARVAPCKADPAADIVWLRPYQKAAVEACVARTRGVIKVPTGGGKTEIACGLTKVLPCRWLFIVHRSSLMDQAAERYELRTGKTAGRIGDGVWREEEFTVATFQTLVRAVAAKDPRASAFLKSVQGVIIDEVHVAPADTFFQVLMALENAYFRVGMSGTPLDRTDKRSVLTIAATGRIIYTITPDVLIDAGVLARPRIKLMAMPQESELPTWQGVYGECVVRSVVRNRAVVDMVRMAEKPCLVFVKEVTHGKRLNKTLMKAGFNSDFVWGTSSTDARKSDVKRLVRGDIDVLVCSVIFQEGIDIPELRSVVIVSGGKSVIATLQRLGRGMRVVAGKKEFEVWDFDDQGNKWLERHARARRKAYVDQGYETILLPRSSQPPLL